MSKRWNKTIDLSLRWDEDWTNENIHEMGKWVAGQIKKVIVDYDAYDKYGYELEEIIMNFEWSICTLQEANDINSENYKYHLQQLERGRASSHFEIIPLEEFNTYMKELYDFADREDVWVKTYF